MPQTPYPVICEPVYRDYPWGGDRIVREYGRPMPPGRYAESWELSTRPEGMGRVANGPWAGRTLQELVEAWGADLLGTRVEPGAFPLLIKLIDARETLSVQVHPDDETAARYGGEAKTEIWYILQADPGACVYAGLREGVGRAEFETALRDGRVETLLRRVPVKPGDVIYVPGGTVHAIGAGCLLLEAQQNSNTTYRLYDWGRVGADGRPRTTHVKQALQAIRWNDAVPSDGDAARGPLPPLAGPGALVTEIRTCPYFRLERVQLAGAWTADTEGRSFQALFIEDGAVALEWEGGRLAAARGTTVLLPAALRGVRVLPENGPANLLRITVP